MTAQDILDRWHGIRDVCHHRPQAWFAWLDLCAQHPFPVSRHRLSRRNGYSDAGIPQATLVKWQRAGLVTLGKGRPHGTRPGPAVTVVTATPKLFRLLRLPSPDQPTNHATT